MKPRRGPRTSGPRGASAETADLALVAKYDGKPIFYYSGDLRQLVAANLTGPPKHSTWAFFLHGSSWTESDLEAAVSKARSLGAVVLMFHGNRAEEAHDIADQAIWSATGYKESLTDSNVVLTTWHDEALSEMPFEVLQVGRPADFYRWSAYCVVSIGSDLENERVHALFRDPKRSVGDSIWTDAGVPEDR